VPGCRSSGTTLPGYGQAPPEPDERPCQQSRKDQPDSDGNRCLDNRLYPLLNPLLQVVTCLHRLSTFISAAQGPGPPGTPAPATSGLRSMRRRRAVRGPARGRARLIPESRRQHRQATPRIRRDPGTAATCQHIAGTKVRVLPSRPGTELRSAGGQPPRAGPRTPRVRLLPRLPLRGPGRAYLSACVPVMPFVLCPYCASIVGHCQGHCPCVP
jgi:hypothetical protein